MQQSICRACSLAFGLALFGAAAQALVEARVNGCIACAQTKAESISGRQTPAQRHAKNRVWVDCRLNLGGNQPILLHFKSNDWLARCVTANHAKRGSVGAKSAKRRAAPSEQGPLGGQRTTRSEAAWGPSLRSEGPPRASRAPLGGSGLREARQRGGQVCEAKGRPERAGPPLGGSGLREARQRGGVMTQRRAAPSKASPLGGGRLREARQRGGFMTPRLGRSEGPLPSKASPLGGQRTRRSRGAWGPHLSALKA
jgi:hypothetical protein